MQKLQTHQLALVVGTFVGLVHLVWVLLVGTGLAGGYLNFILGMHFLSVPLTLLTFSWGGALELVVLTAIIGYVMGAILAYIWNKVGVK